MLGEVFKKHKNCETVAYRVSTVLIQQLHNKTKFRVFNMVELKASTLKTVLKI